MLTLGGVVIVLVISLVNVWNLKQLSDRVATLEAVITPARASGPDPNRIHVVKTSGAIAKGPETAPVTIAEFSDFQCPYCARVATTLKQIEDTYKDRVRIVWKHLPLSIHKDAVGAPVAAEAAGKQGQFWEFHDRLVADRTKHGPSCAPPVPVDPTPSPEAYRNRQMTSLPCIPSIQKSVKLLNTIGFLPIGPNSAPRT